MDLLNITNIDVEKTIKDIIDYIRNEYKDLTKERTCKIYSKLIYIELKKRHIVNVKLEDTSVDYGFDYSHQFVSVVDKDKKYIIDLTYRQFFDEIPNNFKELDDYGYQKVNDISEYLDSLEFLKIQLHYK